MTNNKLPFANDKFSNRAGVVFLMDFLYKAEQVNYSSFIPRAKPNANCLA